MAGDRKHILFVDDYEMLLRAMRLAMKPDRDRWTMEFALGPEKALEALSKHSYDVIVSDMEMPGMNGLELLATVKQRSPHTARVIMSGQLDPDVFVQAASVMHRFLPKPSAIAELRSTLNQMMVLQQELTDEGLRALVASGELPSPPKVYLRLTQAASSRSSSMGDLAEIVAQDPATAGKLLQLANSAYFRIIEPAGSVESAVARLGVEMTRALCLSAYVFSLGGDESALPEALRVGRLQRAAMLSARLARHICTREPEIAFIAALLREVGLLAILPRKRDVVLAIVAELAQGGDTRDAVERRLLGASLAQLSAYLLGLWGLPAAVIDAVRRHGALPQTAPLDAAGAVGLAGALVDAQLGGPALDPLPLAQLGLTDDVARWKLQLEQMIAEADA